MTNRFLGLRLLLVLGGLAVLTPPPVVWAQGGPRAARLREIAANYLGGTADALADLLPGEDIDAALLDPLGGGMFDLEQSLGEAVFAVPVAGNIGYVLRAQVYHDLPIIFPSNWQVVSVLLGDETRWRMMSRSNFVIVQPGESEARTNMTVILSSGELLQIDLEEVTGSLGRNRTGRAYIGPEAWLLERIFALMPRDVRDRMVTAIADGNVRISQLLADPIGTIRAYGDFDALPPPEDGRWARVREHAQGVLTTARQDPVLSGSELDGSVPETDPESDELAPDVATPDPAVSDEPEQPQAPAARLVPLPPAAPGSGGPGRLPPPPTAIGPGAAAPPLPPLSAEPSSPAPLVLPPVLGPPAAGPGALDFIVPDGDPVPVPPAPADGCRPASAALRHAGFGRQSLCAGLGAACPPSHCPHPPGGLGVRSCQPCGCVRSCSAVGRS